MSGFIDGLVSLETPRQISLLASRTRVHQLRSGESDGLRPATL